METKPKNEKETKQQDALMDDLFRMILSAVEKSNVPKVQPSHLGDVVTSTSVNINIYVQPQRKGFFKWLLNLFW